MCRAWADRSQIELALCGEAANDRRPGESRSSYDASSHLDIVIIVAYLLSTVLIGYWVSHRASQSMQNYFLGGNTMPWYVLGISNASGMFDISGTMLLVYWMFVYGLKSVWIPWLWPTFNQIFLMVYLSAWLRRSQRDDRRGVDQDALRHRTRRAVIAPDRGDLRIRQHHRILHLRLQRHRQICRRPSCPGICTPNEYALILVAITAIYVIKGGMISVVITEVVQFCILSIASFAVGIIAMMKVAPETLHRSGARRLGQYLLRLASGSGLVHAAPRGRRPRSPRTATASSASSS